MNIELLSILPSNFVCCSFQFWSCQTLLNIFLLPPRNFMMGMKTSLIPYFLDQPDYAKVLFFLVVPSLKTNCKSPSEIAHPKKHISCSNHQFSGANLVLVSGMVLLMAEILHQLIW